MKTRFIIAVAAVAMLASCGGNGKKSAQLQDSTLTQASREELLQAIAERDQLLSLVNEISATTAEIRNMENIITINASGSGDNSSASQVTSDLSAIQAALEQRRQKIEELERQLKSSGASSANLLATIDALKAETASQAQEIIDLNKKLSDANVKIAGLDMKVDSLTTEVDVTRIQLDQAQQEAKQQEMAANACYYVVATKQELKDHNIIEGGGFLRKQKIMDGDFDKTFFRQADKRNLQVIYLYAKKAKVITQYQPKDSYSIDEVDGQKVLRILDPQKFWSVSDYLVVQVD